MHTTKNRETVIVKRRKKKVGNVTFYSVKITNRAKQTVNGAPPEVKFCFG